MTRRANTEREALDPDSKAELVEVDTETGHVTHLRHIACDDAGTMIIDVVDIGQTPNVLAFRGTAEGVLAGEQDIEDVQGGEAGLGRLVCVPQREGQIAQGDAGIQGHGRQGEDVQREKGQREKG